MNFKLAHFQNDCCSSLAPYVALSSIHEFRSPCCIYVIDSLFHCVRIVGKHSHTLSHTRIYLIKSIFFELLCSSSDVGVAGSARNSNRIKSSSKSHHIICRRALQSFGCFLSPRRTSPHITPQLAHLAL